jgi:hypothetical protein
VTNDLVLKDGILLDTDFFELMSGVEGGAKLHYNVVEIVPIQAKMSHFFGAEIFQIYMVNQVHEEATNVFCIYSFV